MSGVWIYLFLSLLASRQTKGLGNQSGPKPWFKGTPHQPKCFMDNIKTPIMKEEVNVCYALIPIIAQGSLHLATLGAGQFSTLFHNYFLVALRQTNNFLGA